jgi:hypothetical protein
VTGLLLSGRVSACQLGGASEMPGKKTEEMEALCVDALAMSAQSNDRTASGVTSTDENRYFMERQSSG